MSISPVLIAPAVIESILFHTRATLPRECCGALLIRDDPASTNAGEILQAVSILNIAPAPDRFQLDPLALACIESQARRSGLKIAGYYHSHAAGDPQPSSIDYDGVIWPDLSPFFHLIAVPDGRWNLFDTRIRLWSQVPARVS